MLAKGIRLFGTDGIRGTANIEPMSVDTILRVGRAAACVFRRSAHRRHSVLIGKDTRLSGYMFETALASGLCSMGVDVYLVGPFPTPGVAFLTSEMRADAGVVISASHNPYNDNGIKFFGPDGFKLPDAMEEAIENLVRSTEDLNRQRPEASAVGKAHRLDDGRGRYIYFLKSNFAKDLTLEGIKLVADCAHGATYRVAPAVFSELGAEIHMMGVSPDGQNINDACGAVHPEALAEQVRKTHSHFGIAFDGDGDRVVFCDEKGRTFDGDEIMALLGPPMRDRGELGNGVVGTVMSNFGLEKFFAGKKIPFHRAPVGDRYVVEKMREVGSFLGGEQSGHMVNLRRGTTGDGILSALLVLAEVIRHQKPLSAFASLLEKFPQELRNVRVREKKALEELPKVRDLIRSAERKLAAEGRVLVRYSGTEPKVRVMVEGSDHRLVKELADEIASAIQHEIGAS
ncbi:MAG: phosphoglucosamine mutase [Pseudomonadota bacterium]